ncbi:MAG TPA: pyridoxamine 5'-phosphate oxidase family protein [Vicinamibacterales bacterium]
MKALLIMAVTIAAMGDRAVLAQPPAAAIRAAAFDVMRAARYCTLITIGADGQPQARIVDPLIAESEGSIWIATNPLTRKVDEIKRDPRVTLMFFNAAANEYVTVHARAAAVTDAARKAAHWKAEWQPFYKAQTTGADFMLFEVKPFRFEISSPRHKLNNDPETWRPVILNVS